MSSSKIAAAVAVCAAVYACAYGGLVYYQGQKFQEYASDLPKYLGSEWKSVKVNITDNGFFSKEHRINRFVDGRVDFLLHRPEIS